MIDKPEQQPSWHSCTIEETLLKLESTAHGLSTTEVTQRLNQYGKNQLPQTKGISFFKIFFNQFKNALIYVLLIAAIISLFLQEYTDAGVILVVLVTNAIIGSTQEFNAAKNVANLNNLIQTKVRVKRDSHIISLDAKDLVPGDIVILESGCKVAADLRLIEVSNLQIDEAILTGESSSVTKSTNHLDANLSLAERVNIAFSGSSVNSGSGLGVVVATGMHTQIGKIAKVIAHETKLLPPLVVRMERFTQQLSIIVLGMCLLFMLLALWRGFSFMEVFFLSIALAVSAIPEGLPIAITIALSVSTKRMLGRNVIIRKLAAVEGLGSCSVIASDKTGTLTVNKQTIKIIEFTSGEIIQVNGEGYNNIGEITTQNGKQLNPLEFKLVQKIALAGAIANEAALYLTDNTWYANGDEVDIAFLSLAYKAGIKPDFKQELNNLTIIPYQSENKYSGASCQYRGENISVVKGAVETILALATQQLSITGEAVKIDDAHIERQTLRLTARGYRVMALAEKDMKDNSWILIGLVGMQDPLRPESLAAVQECQKAGIKVCMVTGDHPSTALAISKEVGIACSNDQVISGHELEQLQQSHPQSWHNFIKDKSVFARVSPLQKMHIVEGLHSLGNYVAVTGDGVNDVPALKKANIGIAMGSGTDLTKDTADIIIVNDNFSSIIAGVEEGRYAYDNIRKVTYLSVSSALGEIFLLIVAVIIGLPMPLIAIQILWVNLITNGLQDVALAFEAGEAESMLQPPRPKHEALFNRLMIEESLVSGLTIGLICLGFWWGSLKLGIPEIHARSLLFTLLIFLENFHVFNCRSERRSVLRIPLRNNYFVVIAVIGSQLIQLLVAHIPFMQKVLHTDLISWREWLLLFGISLILLLVMELYKLLRVNKLLKTPKH